MSTFTPAPIIEPGMAYQWRTARKPYECADAYQWAHTGRIRPGDRHLVVTCLSSDVVPKFSRIRYCTECGGHRMADPKRTTT